MRAVDNVDRGLLPGSPVEADLDELRKYLNAKKHRLMVPTLEQIEVVIKSIDSALDGAHRKSQVCSLKFPTRGPWLL